MSAAEKTGNKPFELPLTASTAETVEKTTWIENHSARFQTALETWMPAWLRRYISPHVVVVIFFGVVIARLSQGAIHLEKIALENFEFPPPVKVAIWNYAYTAIATPFLAYRPLRLLIFGSHADDAPFFQPRYILYALPLAALTAAALFFEDQRAEIVEPGLGLLILNTKPLMTVLFAIPFHSTRVNACITIHSMLSTLGLAITHLRFLSYFSSSRELVYAFSPVVLDCMRLVLVTYIIRLRQPDEPEKFLIDPLGFLSCLTPLCAILYSTVWVAASQYGLALGSIHAFTEDFETSGTNFFLEQAVFVILASNPLALYLPILDTLQPIINAVNAASHPRVSFTLFEIGGLAIGAATWTSAILGGMMHFEDIAEKFNMSVGGTKIPAGMVMGFIAGVGTAAVMYFRVDVVAMLS